MAQSIIFQNISQLTPWRNKYLRARGIFEIENVNLHHGDIRPYRCPMPICDIEEDYQSMFYNPRCRCLGYADGRKVISAFGRDQYFYIRDEKLYQATEQQLCDGEDCLAGTPIQPQAPSVWGPECDRNTCDGIAVSYVITYVTQLGNGAWVEGSPSPPSEAHTTRRNAPGLTVCWQDAPEGYCIVAVRLYRTESDFNDVQPEVQSSEWILVNEWVRTDEFNPEKGMTYQDNFETSETKYPLITYDPMIFPAPDNLVGIGRTTDGIVVADEHRVYISINGQPMFTWDGVVEVEHKITWLETIGNTIYVFTEKNPVNISYSSRGKTFSIEKTVVNRNLPVSSFRSISNYRGRIIFASEYSLYSWSTDRYGDNIVSVLNPYISPEQWKNLDPDTIVGIQYEYGYIFSSDAIDYSILLEINDDGVDTQIGSNIMKFTYIKKPTAFTLDYEGNIWYSEDKQVKRWNFRRTPCMDFELFDHLRPNACEQCGCCQWSIKFFIDNEGKNHFSHMRVEWDERSAPNLWVSFHIHEFGREIFHTEEMEIISSRGFGLPFKNVGYQACYVHLRGCGIVHQIKVATSAQELVYSSNNGVAGDE